VAGESKGESLGVLLGHFLGRAKKWHKNAIRSARDEIAQYEHPKK
jgi:hypothetical protein